MGKSKRSTEEKDAVVKVLTLWSYNQKHWNKTIGRIHVNNSMFRPDGQWDEETSDYLKSQGAPVITINKIGPTVRQLLGMFAQNEVSWKISSVDADTDPVVAEVLTALFMNVYNENNLDHKRTLVFADGVIGCLGWFGVRVSRDDKSGDVTIKIVKEKNTEVFVNTDACDIFQDDWGRVIRTFWLSPEKLLETFPSVKEEDLHIGKIKQAWRYIWDRMPPPLRNYFPSVMADTNDFWGGGMFRLVEMWEPTDASEYVYFNEVTGEEISSLDDVPEWEQEFWTKRMNKKVKKLRCQTVLPFADKRVQDEVVDYKYFPFAGYAPMNVGLPLLDTPSYVEELISPQEEINRTHQLLAEILAKLPNKAVIFDEQDADLFRDYVNQGSAWAGGVSKGQKNPYVIEQNYPTGLGNYLQQMVQNYIDVSGLPPASRGFSESASEPASLFAMKIRQVAVSIHILFYNFEKSQRMLGLIVLDLIQNYYTREKITRILGEKKTQELLSKVPDLFEQVLGDKNIGKYDVIVEDAPFARSQKQQQVVALLEAIKTMPPEYIALLAPAITQLLPIPNADGIAQQMTQMNAMMTGGQPAGGGVNVPPTPTAGGVPNPSQFLPPEAAQSGSYADSLMGTPQ